jgi:putative DNA primase/helicase
MSVDDVRQAFANHETVPPVSVDQSAGVPDGDAWRADLDTDLAGDVLRQCADFPLNDFGNGQRLTAHFGGDIRFVPRLGWYRWAGRVWRSDEDELDVRRDAQKIAALILDEVPHIALEDWEKDALDDFLATQGELALLEKVKDRTDEQTERLHLLRGIASKGQSVRERLNKAKAAHRAHAKNTGNTSKISNMLQEVRVAAAVPVDALNADPLMINCQTGILRLSAEVDAHAAEWGDKKKVWRVDQIPHDRRHMISKMMLADYNPAADCPKFLAFLETVQPDPEVRDFLQRWFGLTLTGIKTEQKLAFFFGGGRNGKSTLVDTIARIMADYGTTIPIETLTGTEQRKGSDATPDLVRLPGARMARASEPEQGQRMKEALIKALTGGEAIMIRRMQQEFVEIVPEFKLTISGNHKPEVRGADDGIWRRIMLVPFEVQIDEADVDEALPENLWAERDGIFAWLVRGCLDYLNNGLGKPEAVRAATEDYRKDSDPLRVFLTTDCEITGNPDDFEKGRDLSDAFNAYLLSSGEAAWGKRTVSNAIKARAGAMKGPSGHVFTPAKVSDTGYRGIKISTEAMDRIALYGDELRAAAGRRG